MNLFDSFDAFVSGLAQVPGAGAFHDASRALAALFNTVLEFVGLQGVPRVLGGK